MRKVKSFKLRDRYVKILKFLGIVLCICLGVFIFYSKQISSLTKFGYSKKASKNILFSFKKDYVLSKGENKTLNAAFESSDYDEKYLDNYSKIEYVNQKHLIRNINKLIKIGYSNSDIDIILSHGDDDEVTRFTKRDKVRYLEEFYSISYARLDNYDRYVKYSDETGEDEEYVVLYINLNLDKDIYTDAYSVDKFSFDMLINKHRCLNKDFKPDNLVKFDIKYTKGEEYYGNAVAVNAFVSMANAASKEKLGLVINSAYRSYEDQEDTWNYYLSKYGDDYVNKFVAKPGFSEHQTGLSFDIGSTSSNVFANSKEYKWMLDNAYKYGFILRFTKKYESITQFRNEPWHYRYVGKDIAKYIHEHNISFEEYYAMFLDK